MTTLNNYYVYAHQRLDDDSIFYIGKGHGKRAWEVGKRNKHWKGIVNKAGYRVLILQDGMSETDSFTLEKYLIAFYGRADLGEGRLVNMTDGGEGTSGRNQTQETRKNISESKKGKTRLPFTEDHRKKLSEAGKGKNRKSFSEETRKNMSESKKGTKLSEETKKKISEVGKGQLFFNDGTKSFRINPEDALPHYKKGRLK
jgi:hypothetical protein